MGLFIVFIPSRPYNPFLLSTLLNLCIKNKDLLGFFSRKRKETTVYISGIRKETTFKKEDILRNGNGNGYKKSFPLSLAHSPVHQFKNLF